MKLKNGGLEDEKPFQKRAIVWFHVKLVGAQPPPCCSFARHLVGKMVIHCSFAHH